MVKALHEADIEVILDVVYNHTAEGNHMGPTMCFRGIDNAAYYRLVDEDRAHYYDTTGTGNSLLMRHPHVLQLIMDSLRYWVTEMHVDGFRFDLAATLPASSTRSTSCPRSSTSSSRTRSSASQAHRRAGTSARAATRSATSRRCGPSGTASTATPSATSGAARARRWGSSPPHHGVLGPLPGRRPHPIASINFVTAHDGFTLRDLVSYNEKHNDANGEGAATARATTARGTAVSRAD